MAAPIRKPSHDASAEPAASPERVRCDLERRGLAAPLAQALAARIAPRAAELPEDAYALFLDGVAAAHGAVPGEQPSGKPAGSQAVELQHLMQDFAVELKKLDEGLRLLSAYLLRIRDRTGDGPRIVH